MAILLALASSAMWGTADFLGGLWSRQRVALAVVGGSQLAGLVAVAIAAVITGEYAEPLDWLPWSIGAGAIGGSGLVAYYAALSRGTMGVVAPIAALGVIVPVVVSMLQGETPTVVQVAGIAVALVGVVAASGPELSGSGSAISVLLAAFAGICFGLVFLLLARGAESSAVMTMVGMRGTSVVGFAVVAARMRSIGGMGLKDMGPLVVIGVFDAGANLTYAIASTMGFVSVVSVLGSLYPVATILLARTFLHERMRWVQQVGVVVAFVGVTLIVVR